MECLVAIGTTIVTTIAELTVAPIIRQVGYTIHYNENLKKLKNQVGELSRARESMQHSVETEERKGNKIEESVQFWLKEVNQLTKQADDFMKDEHHAATKCLRGFCPNLKLRHRLSRKSKKLGLEVAELEKKNNFANIAYAASLEEVCTIAIQDYEAFDSRTSTAEDVINELRKSDTYMIGVYGIGGVGKTTLVKEVYKQAKHGEKLFDEVVMVLDLKQNPSIERIQKAIAEKLGLELSEAGTIAGRATKICNRIKNKKTLVILDDVWENIDLEAVGLPRMATLKLLLTSRSKLVLATKMGTQREFHLKVLNKEESWSLFKKMAGDIVERPDLQSIAAQVAEKCGGLPLLIVTVARALKDSPSHDWRDTFRRLKKLDEKGLTEKTYSAIEWSYNKLESEELKLVFLLCASEVDRSNSVMILDLLKYSMGLGVIKNVDTMEEARDALHSVLKKLKYSCLLLDEDDNQWVRIHDHVKAVAKHIAARDHHVLSVSHESALKEWPDKEFCRKCTRISLKKCNTSEFPEVMKFPELIMLVLGSDDVDSREIPSNFFKEMKKLKVLDLTNRSIPSLPSSLKWLKHLQTLCLDSCTLGDIALVGELQNLEILSFLYSKFHKLPEEIGQLSRLVLLDLTGCSQLEVIQPNVISRLRKLEELRMGKNSFNKWEVERVVDNSRSNASLEEIKHLHRLTALQIHIPDANILPVDLFTGSKLERFQICIGSVWKWDDVDEAFNALKLQLTTSNELDKGLKMLLQKTEDLYVEGMEGVKDRFFRELASGSYQLLKHLHVHNNVEFAYTINEKVGFSNLTWLAVSELNSLRFLFSFSMAKSLSQLKRLHITGCQIMEEIISIEESNKEFPESIFCQLQELELKGLPNLTKFCSTSYVEVPNLSCQILQLEDSIESSTTCEEIEEIDSKGSLDMVVQHFLFDNKVELPVLESLSLKGLTKLATIWHSQLSLNSFSGLKDLKVQGCANLTSIFVPSTLGRLNALATLIIRECESLRVVFQLEELDTKQIQDSSPSTQLKSFHCENLDSVEIDSCESLINIFPVSVARNLKQLKELKVKSCGVKEIVAREDGLQTTPQFVFPKATRVTFMMLSQLTSFYPGMHVSSWPMLNDLKVIECFKANTLVNEISSFHGYDQHDHLCSPIPPSLFSIDQDSFHNLEWLVCDGTEICKGPLQVHLFSKLKLLDVAGLQIKSAVFLKGNSRTSNSAIGTQQQQQWQLPHLKELRLVRLAELMHLGQEDEEDSNSQSAPNIPYLEILRIIGCHSLRNLRSSAVSFHNLTTLDVSFCHKLEYLMTYSMANSLMLLTTLEVKWCIRLVEIVGSNEDGNSRKEITFRRLKHLKLSRLPRLQGFCSEDCIVKFPSLETLTMSNRLKLKIFPTHDEMPQITTENEDTYIDFWEKYLAAEDKKNTGTD